MIKMVPMSKRKRGVSVYCIAVVFFFLFYDVNQVNHNCSVNCVFFFVNSTEFFKMSAFSCFSLMRLYLGKSSRLKMWLVQMNMCSVHEQSS